MPRLPDEAWQEPDPHLVLGQLEWGLGHHERAIPSLREAVAGYDARDQPLSAWLARSILCDALFSTGGFDEIEPMGGVCKFTLTHYDYEKAMAGIETGWPMIIAGMKTTAAVTSRSRWSRSQCLLSDVGNASHGFLIRSFTRRGNCMRAILPFRA